MFKAVFPPTGCYYGIRSKKFGRLMCLEGRSCFSSALDCFRASHLFLDIAGIGSFGGNFVIDLTLFLCGIGSSGAASYFTSGTTVSALLTVSVL